MYFGKSYLFLVTFATMSFVVGIYAYDTEVKMELKKKEE